VSIITLTTDFGTGSPYVAAMKGVILSINPAATIVDVTHAIPPQDVRHGALVLDEVTRWFHPGTIHVAVIDPGVGTERAILYARIGGQQYIAPDNGLLSKLASRSAPEAIHRLEDPAFWLEEVSSTFHGRDIMAPAAAHLSLGVEPARLGPPVEAVGGLEWPPVVIKPRRIEGVVLQIDSFGNLVTNVRSNDFLGRPTDERVCVICSIYETWGIYSAYAQQPQDTLIALVGSSGHLELAIVGDNAARRLGIPVGTKVIVTWE